MWDFSYVHLLAANDEKVGDAVKARPTPPVGGEGDREVGIPGGAVRDGETVEAGGGR